MVNPDESCGNPNRCESWEHVVVGGSAPPAAPERLTCAAHHHEEDEYRSVLIELGRVERAIAQFTRQRSGRHQKKAEDFIEDAVREFFRPVMAERGVSVSSAYQYQGATECEYDIAASADLDDPDAWNASATVRVLRGDERVALHVEVAYRSCGSAGKRAPDATRKLKKDVDKLVGSLELATAHAHDALPWTALVLLGDGWPAPDALMSWFHDLHSGPGVRRVTLGDRPWWAMLDVIVSPGAFFKKHDVFWSEDAKALWPAYQHFAVAPDSIARGLAIARVFLAHRLDVRLGRKSPESDAFGYASDLATWGPVSRAVPVAAASASAYLMHAPRHARQVFGFEGWSQQFGLHPALLGDLESSPVSAKGVPFRVRFGR